MARAPDERIIQAKAMYLKGTKLVEIASQLNLPEGTVRRWKSTHKWDNERSDKKSERSHKKGPPAGNRNAAGNKGGAAPENNKNAVKTGEFETLFFDALEEDEKRLIGMVQLHKEQLLLQEIQLLTVRERRMLKRIEDIKRAAEEQEDERAAGMTAVKYKDGLKDESTEYTGALGQIQAVEDALTRVQARKQKAVDSLHRYGLDDTRLELEMMKLELEIMKQDNPEQEIEEDGFMAAMNGIASEVWGDEDD